MLIKTKSQRDLVGNVETWILFVQCGEVGHKEGYCSCFPDEKSNLSKNVQQHQKSCKKKKFNKTHKTIKSVYGPQQHANIDVLFQL